MRSPESEHAREPARKSSPIGHNRNCARVCGHIDFSRPNDYMMRARQGRAAFPIGFPPWGARPLTPPDHSRPMSIDEIIDNLALIDQWDDRYRYVIELGRSLPPIEERHRNQANKVQGCASQ